MKKQLLLLPLLGISLTSCGAINETFQALECNRQAVEASTCAIYENAQAVEQSNMSIDENRRQLDAINKTLKEASEQS